ncbi:hypothetical protein [Nitrobacter sp. JJSN]|uniref:hypothetical protein n=1 Tax=Nitrobacter sp. JJSN TaxID=3453033 RepID=UPI003F75D382
MRLALKRPRDVVGFFPPSLGSKKPYCQYERCLARLQEQLGRDNDMLIAKEVVQKIAKRNAPAAGRHTPRPRSDRLHNIAASTIFKLVVSLPTLVFLS